MSNIINQPKWAREIIRFLPIKPQYILWGNVHDIFPMQYDDGRCRPLKLVNYLQELMGDYDMVLLYEPIIGFTLLAGKEEDASALTGKTIKKDAPCESRIGEAYKIIEKVISSKEHSAAVIIDHVSRMPDLANSSHELSDFYYHMYRLIDNIFPIMKKRDGEAKPAPTFNAILWILEKENDMPAWYGLDNPKVRILPIPKPDLSLRRAVVDSVASIIPGYNALSEAAREESKKLFADQTNGLYAKEIIAISQMAKKENTSSVAEAIKNYKLGIVENLWQKLDINHIANAEEILSRSVMGQERAVRQAADILKRSFYNLSGAQFSRYPQKPKGILFLAGPTGVGKTELAKAITKLIFGSATSYIRFDMSEFGQEHTNQRLIGAPPGYVGYDVGGELTNAVKQNPFSVILFDEIEKACPKIMDMFLQILDDGRLTSGRGETVYFTEALIIFTSNLGMYEESADGSKIQVINQDATYEETTQKITAAINNFFNFKISRPEILNRLGKNIVVFDFIRHDTAKKIFEHMLDNVKFKLEESFNIKLLVEGEAKQKLEEEVTKDLSMGGRGIGNNIEEIFVNPLSRKLFETAAKPGDIITLKSITKTSAGWDLSIEQGL